MRLHLQIFIVLSIIYTGVKSDSFEKIVNGVRVPIARVPYQVSIQYFNQHLCGGSIIKPQYVITAAHCVFRIEPTTLSIRAGSGNISKGGTLVRVCSLAIHNNYNSSNFDNDVAILMLCRKLPMARGISVINLAGSAEHVKAGAAATVSGWGTTKEDGIISPVLRLAKVTFISPSTCQRLYSREVLTENMLCAGSLLGGSDSCQGDSGGPLVYGNKLVGIVSWGYGCGRPLSPGVYTRVSAVRCWIKMLIGL